MVPEDKHFGFITQEMAATSSSIVAALRATQRSSSRTPLSGMRSPRPTAAFRP